jgi:3'(2'), 5'-bisphosphate nucleotidase
MDDPDMGGSPLGCTVPKNQRIAGRAGLGRDTPHARQRQGLPNREESRKDRILTTDSEIAPAQAAELLDELTAVVARASAAICDIAVGTVAHRLKADQSPVTVADEASEAIILAGVARLLPYVPVVSEEMAGKTAPPPLKSSFILVDPLDGTKEFIAGRDEFTVNLAILTGGVPIAGIISAPKQNKIWRGVVGRKVERLRLLPDGADQAQTIRARRWPEQGAVAVVSRSHYDPKTDAFLARLPPVAHDSSGSSIKFCRIAEGAADVYPRLGTTCEWDIAAGHALVLAAGGIVTTTQGGALPYGRVAENFRVPSFIAWGDPAKAALIGQ